MRLFEAAAQSVTPSGQRVACAVFGKTSVFLSTFNKLHLLENSHTLLGEQGAYARFL